MEMKKGETSAASKTCVVVDEDIVPEWGAVWIRS